MYWQHCYNFDFSVTYEGDNFVRFSGDTQKMAQTQSMFIAEICIRQYKRKSY